jgi:phosphate transport system protein
MHIEIPKTLRSQFERQLQDIQNDVLRMGALVEHSCWLAHQALFQGALALVDELKQQDRRIDEYYRRIEVNCLQLMALQAPVANDLRLIGALMQLVRDLERIGDYAKELGEVSIKLAPYAALETMDDIERMSTVCRSMLAMCLSALTDLDGESGLQLKNRDDEVDDLYDHVYHTLAHQTQFSESVEPLLLMTLAIRALERMADHATNVGRRVAFIVTGQR